MTIATAPLSTEISRFHLQESLAGGGTRTKAAGRSPPEPPHRQGPHGATILGPADEASPDTQHRERDPRSCRGGINPAGAESSSLPTSGGSEPGGHPRGCGEQYPCTIGFDLLMGPSLPVRGADPLVSVAPDQLGTIPAGAGSSTGRARTSPWTWDHPRRCGGRVVGRLIAGAPSTGTGGHPRGCGEQSYASASL